MRVIFAALLASWSMGLIAAVSALDSDGRRLTLPAPAQRIVSLAPHVTELLFAAGAGDKLIAVSEYSDFPEAAKRLPRAAYRDRPAIDVFYQISPRPLMSLNGRHFVSDALALCGGRNVFASAAIIAPVVGIEAVLAADPAVIVAARPDPADASWQEF